MGVASEIEKKVLDYLLVTPKALAIFVASFLSGHLWIFVIKAFRKRTKASNLMESKTGRVAIGLIWMASVSAVIYMVRFRDMSFEYDKIMIIAIPTIVTALFLQLIVFVTFLLIGDK